MQVLGTQRLVHVPRRDDDAWQGGLVRLPLWVRGDGPLPFRPWVGGWVSRLTGQICTTSPAAPGDRRQTLALEALIELATDSERAGYLPGCLEINDPALAAYLEDELASFGVKISLVEELADMDRVLMALSGAEEGVDLRPPALAASGVDVEGMRAFAQAAKLFYEARPWDELTDGQLFELEQPAPPKTLRYVVVMGAAGIDTGLFFFSSVRQHAAILESADSKMLAGLGPCWLVSFAALSAQPTADANLWEDHALPVASAEAYPMVLWVGSEERPQRPDASTLEFIEGVLRCLAFAAESGVTCQRISRTISTYSGSRRYTLIPRS